MSENVVSLRGNPVRNDERQTADEIISDLEELLERAKAGEVVAVGMAIVVRGPAAGAHLSDFMFCYNGRSAHDLLASIARLRRAYEDYLFAETDG